MPKYRVKEPGFFNGRWYDPNGKRQFLHTEEPFKKSEMPSWLELVKDETAAEKKARLKQEKEQADADAKKAEQDQKDISDASFLGEGEQSGGAVETL